MTEKKEQTRNFWNDWDFKSILAIIIPLVAFSFGYGNLTGKVSSIEEKHGEDVRRFQEDVREIKILLKEYIKEQTEKEEKQQHDIKEFYKHYKLEQK